MQTTRMQTTRMQTELCVEGYVGVVQAEKMELTIARSLTRNCFPPSFPYLFALSLVNV